MMCFIENKISISIVFFTLFYYFLFLVLSVDSFSKNLNNLLKNGETQEHQILQTLIKWKTIFSKKWWIQNHFDYQPVQSLKNVWKILFQLVESQDSTVSIASFNAIGALLISLSPFYSDYLIDSFREVVNQDLSEVTPNTSIAVISTFVYLSHLVGPHRNQNFFETIIVLHFFKADLYSFIQYVPQLIKQMSQMNLEFHQSLFFSLLTSYVQNPNSQFVESLLCLMEHFPRRLMNEFSQFLESNGTKLNGLLFAMGSKLLESKLLSCYLNEKQISIMFEESKKLFDDTPSASSLEQGVGILSKLSKMDTKATKDVNSFIDSIFLKDYPPHIKRNLLPLSRNIEYVTPCENDSSNVLAAKVAALGNFGPELDRDVISILLKLVSRNDEVFTSVADFLATHLDGFMQRANDDITKSNISFIINTIINFSCGDKNTNRNWVQQAAVAGFIEKNNQFKCESFVPDYIQKCVKFLIETSISPHESLSKKAREAASSFVGLHNIDFILSTLLINVDLFNENAPYKVILLLNELYEKVPSPLYYDFIKIFDEIVNNSNSKPLISEFLFFLSHFDSSAFPHRYEKLCLDLIQHYYLSFTQISLTGPSVLGIKEVPSLLQNVTTDIVANPSLNPSILLEPLHKCFKFLLKMTQPPINLVISLLPLFPYDSLICILNQQLNPHQIESLVQEVSRIFNCSQNLTVSALCVKFLIKYSKEALSKLISDLISMIHAKQVQTAYVADIFIKAIRKINDTNWNQYAICLLSDLPIVERNLFALKLMKIADDQFKELVKIQFPFTEIDTKPDVCFDWLKKNSMTTWPINRKRFSEKVADLLKEKGEKIVLDCYEMDEKHWNYLFEKKELFDISILKDKRDCIKSHFNLFEHCTTVTSNIFNFKSISVIQKEKKVKIPKLATISPSMKKFGNYVKSAPLLVSFFNHSSISISRELFNRIINEDIEKFVKSDEDKKRIREASIEYSKRFGFYEMDNEAQLDINEISNNSIKKKDLRNICINTTQYTPISYMDRIASVYSPLIEKIAKPKKMYYFVRFLRIVLSMNLRNYQGIRSMVAQLLSNDSLISVIYSDDQFSDFLLKEIAMLILDNFSIKEQNEYSSKYSILSPFLASSTNLRIQSLIEVEIPSYISLALKICSLNESLDPIPFFQQNILLPFSMPLVNREYSQYLSKHINFLIGADRDNKERERENRNEANKESYVNPNSNYITMIWKKILDLKNAAIDEYFDLIIILLSCSKDISITDFKTQFLDDAANNYYQMGTLVDIIHVYFLVLLREITSDDNNNNNQNQNSAVSTIDDENKKKKDPKTLSQFHQMFKDEASMLFKISSKYATLHNMIGLSTCLINHSFYNDVIIPVNNKLKNKNCPFYLAYIVALKVIDALDQDKLHLLNVKINKLIPIMKKLKQFSRVKVLQMLIKGIYNFEMRERAFLYALSESMTLKEIEEMYGINQIQKESSDEILSNIDNNNENENENKNTVSDDENDDELNLESSENSVPHLVDEESLKELENYKKAKSLLVSSTNANKENEEAENAEVNNNNNEENKEVDNEKVNNNNNEENKEVDNEEVNNNNNEENKEVDNEEVNNNNNNSEEKKEEDKKDENE